MMGLVLRRTHAESRRRRVRYAAQGLVFEDETLGAAFPLKDISNEGFAYELPVRDRPEALDAGRGIPNVVLSREGRVVLAGARATVRHVTAFEDRYRVGCEFLSTWIDPSDRPPRLQRLPDVGTFRPKSAEPIRVKLESALLAVRSHVRAVEEVSGARLSFRLASDGDLFPEGMRFDAVSVYLGPRVLRCRGRVRALTPPSGEARVRRCLVDLEELREQDRFVLADAITERRFPKLSDASDVTADELLSFSRRSGFLSAEKEQALSAGLHDVRRTFDALCGRRSSVFKAVGLREGGELKGYISSALAYSSTLVWQHLSVAPGRCAAGSLILALGTHRSHDDDFEYVKFWFLEDKRFSSSVLASFGRKISDPAAGDMRLYAHVPLGVDRAPVAKSEVAGLHVSAAGEEDFVFVERYFANEERGLLPRADDLNGKELSLGSVNERYEALGLFRRRHVFVARYRGVRVGFALAEISSKGLNLYGGLSSFRLHTLADGAGMEEASTRALLLALQSFYRAEGESKVLGLVPVSDVETFERVGAPSNARSFCITFRRSLLPEFLEHVSRVTASARARRAPFGS